MKTKRFLAIGAKGALVAFMVFGLVIGSMAGFVATVHAGDTATYESGHDHGEGHHDGDNDHHDGDHHNDGDNDHHDNGHDNDGDNSNHHDDEHDNDGDDNNNGGDHGDHHQNLTGSIRVCVLVLDENWDMLDSSAVTGVTFEVPGITETTVYGATTGELPSTFVTTPLEKNTRLLDWTDGATNDANCTTYSDLELGNYYYGQEVISGGDYTWETTMYHDDAADVVYNYDYFTAYGNHLFDNDSTNDWNDVYTADGHIPLYEAEPHATLVVINRLITTTDNGGDTGETGGDTGGTGGDQGGDTTGDTGGSTGGSAIGGGAIGGGAISVASTGTQGQVLGVAACGTYLNDYLRYGYKNNPDEVKKLQTFLNSNLGISLDVNGTFDRNTESAVKLFQKRESITVLNPWKSSETTGIVYMTTKTRINNLSCGTLNAPIPSKLIKWKANPETLTIPQI